MKTNKIVCMLIIIAILIRIPLLFLNPISMWADPVFRFIPNTYDILKGDFSFYTPPLLMMLNSLPTIFLQGFLLELSWKIIPFLFFILSCFVFIKILKIIELNKTGKILLLCLFLFSIYSMLMSTTVMLEMLVLFFTLVLFYVLEKDFELNFEIFMIITLASTLLLYSKQTGYFILAGFFLYVIFKKMDKKKKKLILIAIILGLLLNVPWMIKNQVLYSSVLGGDSGAGQTPLTKMIEIANPFPIALKSFEYFYRFPPLGKMNYSGLLFILSRIYYFTFLISGIFLWMFILMGVLKFWKRYYRYILIVLPIFLFSFFWSFLYWEHGFHDFGRYMFSLYFIIFFFGIKFIEEVKNINIRRLGYIIIVLICILSIITSFAASYDFYKRDKEIRNVSDRISELKGVFIANDMFTTTTLTYYSGKDIQFLLDENIIDTNIKCNRGELYSSEMYKISFVDEEYHICKL